MRETKLQREARSRGLATRRAVGIALRDLRMDAGLTMTAVAASAGVDRAFLGRIERGERPTSLATLTAVAGVLGADLSVRVYPTTGPRIRDRFQAPMGEALLRFVHRRWTRDPEVGVHRPARGVIDLVLSDQVDPTVVATELQSEVRRLEQQIRWHRLKEESLPSADLWPLVSAEGEPRTSRLLVLRSTRATRLLANEFESTLRAAYPATTRDVLAALGTPDAPWPGAGIIWIRVDAGRAELLDAPPRGVRLGR